MRDVKRFHHVKYGCFHVEISCDEGPVTETAEVHETNPYDL